MRPCLGFPALWLGAGVTVGAWGGGPVHYLSLPVPHPAPPLGSWPPHGVSMGMEKQCSGYISGSPEDSGCGLALRNGISHRVLPLHEPTWEGSRLAYRESTLQLIANSPSSLPPSLAPSRSRCCLPTMPARCGPVALASTPLASQPACPWSSPSTLGMPGRGCSPSRSWWVDTRPALSPPGQAMAAQVRADCCLLLPVPTPGPRG